MEDNIFELLDSYFTESSRSVKFSNRSRLIEMLNNYHVDLITKMFEEKNQSPLIILCKKLQDAKSVEEKEEIRFLINAFLNNYYTQIKAINKTGGYIAINYQDSIGKTALHYAIEAQDNEIVGGLIEKGANPLIKDNSNHSATYYYSKLSQKIDIKSRALFVAIDDKNFEVVKALIKSEKQILAVTNGTYTPKEYLDNKRLNVDEKIKSYINEQTDIFNKSKTIIHSCMIAAISITCMIAAISIMVISYPLLAAGVVALSVFATVAAVAMVLISYAVAEAYTNIGGEIINKVSNSWKTALDKNKENQDVQDRFFVL